MTRQEARPSSATTQATQFRRPRLFLERSTRKELEIPEFGILPPSQSGADLDREVGGFDLIPATHFDEDRRNGRQQAFPDMISGEHLALKDDDLFVGLTAATAFGHIGPEAAPAIPALIQALRNQHRLVRFNSVYSLELLGPLAKDAVPALKAALNDSDPDVRRTASEALQKIDPAKSSE